MFFFFVEISKILLYWSILEDIEGQSSVNNDTDTTEIGGHQLIAAAHNEHMVNTEFNVIALLSLREVKSLPRDGEHHPEFHLTTEKCLTAERGSYRICQIPPDRCRQNLLNGHGLVQLPEFPSFLFLILTVLILTQSSVLGFSSLSLSSFLLFGLIVTHALSSSSSIQRVTG